MKRSKSVDDYIRDADYWREELKRLRDILKSTDLVEEVKWGGPCYTINGQNVVGLGAFKSYFGLWFFQGALLADDEKILINAQEGRTKALRQWRMTSPGEIRPALIKNYVNEAIELAREGRKIAPDRNRPVVVSAELEAALRKDKAAGESFRKLRPGLQREYADYVADAKREETRRRRIEKILPMIRKGTGLHDRYR
ncbi:MAG: YdeI family protein [Woeseia sp.]